MHNRFTPRSVKRQAKDTEHLFSETIAENFPHFGEDMDIQGYEAFRIPTRTSLYNIINCPKY